MQYVTHILHVTFEVWMDRRKLCGSRRPLIVERSHIGAWRHALAAMSTIAVLTNVSLVYIHLDEVASNGS